MKSQSLSEELLARSTKIPLKQGSRHLKALFAAHREEIGGRTPARMEHVPDMERAPLRRQVSGLVQLIQPALCGTS